MRAGSEARMIPLPLPRDGPVKRFLQIFETNSQELKYNFQHAVSGTPFQILLQIVPLQMSAFPVSNVSSHADDSK